MSDLFRVKKHTGISLPILGTFPQGSIFRADKTDAAVEALIDDGSITIEKTYESSEAIAPMTVEASLKSRDSLGLGHTRRTLEDFGAVGDYDFATEKGTDDSAAIQAALEWFLNTENSNLIQGPKNYLIANPVRVLATGNNAKIGQFLNFGGWFQTRITPIAGIGTIGISGATMTGVGTSFLAQLKVGHQIVVNGTAYSIRSVESDLSATILIQNSTGTHTEAAGSTFVVWPPAIILLSDGSNRRPDFTALRFRGHPDVTGGSNFSIYGVNGADKTWDGVCVHSMFTQRNYTTALEIGPGVFEANFNNLELGGQDGGDRHLVRVLQGAGGDISSVHFYAPNLRGGLNGLISTAGDVRIYGGTAINAKSYEIVLNNLVGILSGFHVENNFWGSAPADGQAGINVIGAGVVEGVYGLRGVAQSGQRHILRVYASNDITVLGGSFVAPLGGDTFAYVQTTGAGHALFVGNSSIVDAGGSNYSLFVGGKFIPTILKYKANTYAYAATVTPNLNSGPRIVVTGITGGFTLANPTGISPTGGERIVLELTPEATGGRAVAFGSAYLTASAVTTTLNKTTLIEFMYTAAGKWQEMSRTAA